MFKLFARTVRSKISSSDNMANKALRLRALRLERLEDRALLSVSTAEYTEIRDAYPALELPETTEALNVIEIEATKLTVASLKDAIAKAETTTSDDLIVVRTTDEFNSITYADASDEITINVDSTTYGVINVVGYGSQPLIINAAHKSRVLHMGVGRAGMVNLTITGGKTTSNGGGIYVNKDGKFTVTDTTIAGNSADSGGGVCVAGSSTFTAVNTTIAENSADDGGGVYVADSSTFTAVNSRIAENSADDGGGGVYAHSTFMASNTTISGNSAGRFGGGVYIVYNETFTVVNSIIAGNSADDGGGVYVGIDGFFTAIGSTIAGNSADDGGGVFVYSEATFTATNIILAMNYGLNLCGALSSQSSNNLVGYFPSFICVPEFDAEGNLTNADSLDLRLRSDSLAIDAGSNSVVEETSTDMDGKARIYNEKVDIGAYEYQGDRDDKSIYSSVVDTLNDSFDLNDGEWSLREAIYYASKYETITFAENLSGTINLTCGILYVDKALMIDGAGRIAIDANSKSRVMNVGAGTVEKSIVLNGLTLQNGREQYNGGGIYVSSGKILTTNTTIKGNYSAHGGGGVYIASNGTFTAKNTTIAGNFSYYYNNGGVYVSSGGTFTAKNSILAMNYGLNLVGELSSGSSNNLIGYYPSFVCDPVFDAKGFLTNADSLDLRLRSDSPAIDAGSNDLVPDARLDADGNQRVCNGTVDIGAYEYQGDREDKPFYSTIVDTLNDSFDLNDGEWSLREAIYYAPKYVTITFAENLNGTIDLKLGELRIAKSLEIDGAQRIVIDAGQKSGVIYVVPETLETPVVLNGLTIQNGNCEYGGLTLNQGELLALNTTITKNRSHRGGVCVWGGTLTATNCVVSENFSSMGGGFYVREPGTLKTTNTVITNNSSHWGGGVFIQAKGTFTASNTIIEKNTAWEGGGVCVYSRGTFTATNTIIRNNAASEEGGGVYNVGAFTATNTTISGNSATTAGGVYNVGAFTATNTTISGNSTTTAGGGVYNIGAFTATNTTISGNSAITAGGVCCYGTFMASNVLIVKNSAEEGGGVYCDGTFMASNATISGNSAENGGGVYVFSRGTFVSNNSIVVLNSNGSDVITEDGATTTGSNNLSTYAGWFGDNNYEYDATAPLFKNRDKDDYRLAPRSQALNKGNDQYAHDAGILATSTDLAGKARFVGSSIDIGAYEYQLDITFYQPISWTDSIIVSTSSTATSSKTTFSTTQNVYLRFAYKSTEAFSGISTQTVYVDGRLVKSYKVNGSSSTIDDGLIVKQTIGKLSVGLHTITVKLDVTNAVDEADEDNNERSFTVNVPSDDKFEPNDSRTKAYDLGTISETTTYTNLIAGIFSNKDWYRFTFTHDCRSDACVELKYTHVKNEADVNLYLYNASGRRIKSSTKETGTETFSLEGLVAGTYYIYTYNCKNVDVNVNYTLTIEPGTLEPTTDLAFYQPNRWSNLIFASTSVYATSGKTTFSTTENVTLRYAFKSNEALDDIITQEIRLDGKRLDSYDVDCGAEGVVDGIEAAYTLGKLTAGTHTISVRLDSTDTVIEKDESNNEFSITITVLKPEDDKYEANDSRAKATNFGTLTATKTYSNLVAGMFSNQDWYKFALPNVVTSDSYILLNYEHITGQSDVNLYLYNSSGRQIAKSTGATGVEKISLSGLDAGTYYVRAYNSKRVSINVPYELTLIPPVASDLAFYQPDGWNDSVIAVTNSNATKGKTTFSTLENVTLRYAFKSDDELDDTFIQEVYLDGKLVTSTETDGFCDAVADGVEYKYSLGALSAGNHVISVKLDAENTVGESNENNNEQTITITVLESKDDAYESNDTRLKASNLGTLESTQTYANLVAGMFGNQDWYKFTLAKDGTSDSYVELNYKHVTGKADVNLYLYNASGKQLVKSTGATGNEKISFDGLAAGTYYVKAYNAKNVSTDVAYTLTFTTSKVTAASATSTKEDSVWFRNAFEDESFTPFDDDDFGFVQELLSTFDTAELFDDEIV